MPPMTSEVGFQIPVWLNYGKIIKSTMDTAYKPWGISELCAIPSPCENVAPTHWSLRGHEDPGDIRVLSYPMPEDLPSF